MDRIIFSILLLITCLLLYGCERHNADDFLFTIINNSSETVWFRSFNNGAADATNTSLSPRNTTVTGGGGILDVDSVLFIRISDNDTLVYRNERHGGDLLKSNHFFNINNWVEEDTNKFFYYVSDEDFDL